MGMIAAANDFFDKHLVGWQRSEDALVALKSQYPGFDGISSLVKAAAINGLYGTNVDWLAPLADKISKVLATSNRPKSFELIEQICQHPLTKSSHVSFAAKFAHFFIDDDEFLPFDTAACLAARVLTDDAFKDDPSGGAMRYSKYCAAIEQLTSASHLIDTYRRIDRFMWIYGSCRRIWGTGPRQLVIKQAEGHDRANVAELRYELTRNAHYLSEIFGDTVTISWSVAVARHRDPS
jgi:hypothetical protein